MLDSLPKTLVTLKVLNFDYSDSLKEIPDVSSLQNLQELSFQRCRNLVTVHGSVGFLNKLTTLNAAYCCKLRSFPLAIKLPSLEKLYLFGCSSLENFPEILEKIENLKHLSLEDTGIKDLPCSFRNLSGLTNLSVSGDEMCKIPSVVFMMPKLFQYEFSGRGNKGMVLGKQEERWIQGILGHSLQSSNVVCLNLIDMNLSDDFFPLAVACFPNVDELELSDNNFTVLPECIQQFRFLLCLRVDGCIHLREIRGIPPILETFSAVDCKSLSLGGTNVLLNQLVSRGKGYWYVGSAGSIPRWFEQRCNGSSICFWFRGTKFPCNALCFAILLTYDACPLIHVSAFKTINGTRIDELQDEAFMGQLFIFRPQGIIDGYAHPNFYEGWNYVEVSYEARLSQGNEEEEEVSIESIAKEIGVHVVKQKISSSIIEDIRFTNPYKMTELIIMMMMLSIVLPNHKKQPLLLETCIGLWTLLGLTHWFWWEAEEDFMSEEMDSMSEEDSMSEDWED
ncbi:hypothetical protein PIB30_004281 [Stylosanthes scabra]|uniref:Disease resistance protein RPS4B/Roq1-like leucine-rich repeats domain-containing protein n=1 Tax=Stylosanthes scabra TaxID=79078 RepID=A0ABU6T3C0_9FABA|nr:hypothetical protein [Stylosanthes scabra]